MQDFYKEGGKSVGFTEMLIPRKPMAKIADEGDEVEAGTAMAAATRMRGEGVGDAKLQRRQRRGLGHGEGGHSSCS